MRLRGWVLALLQAAQARAEEAEATLRAVRAQAEQARQQAGEQQAQLEGQLSELKQQLARATTAQQLQVGGCGKVAATSAGGGSAS